MVYSLRRLVIHIHIIQLKSTLICGLFLGVKCVDRIGCFLCVDIFSLDEIFWEGKVWRNQSWLIRYHGSLITNVR